MVNRKKKQPAVEIRRFASVRTRKPIERVTHIGKHVESELGIKYVVLKLHFWTIKTSLWDGEFLFV